uniref:Retrovirus-related Pol polyprotein from transposon TNT 1-94 n=1 Tax=Tanacetum cinerariifolium TaxID=118510 RepID=A0A6L2JTU5_TANCI|nr:retrovirus-related Pol polyprotein from transposon TNT 1-94 [Tanacetum cinerariifolium]
MNGVGNELVVKQKRERSRMFVAMPNPSIVPPQKNKGRPRGSRRKQRLADVDMNSKGKEQVSQKAIVKESVDDRAVWDKVKISNEYLAKIKAKYVGDYKTIRDDAFSVSETEDDDVEDNDTEDDDDDYDYEVGWYDTDVKRDWWLPKMNASTLKVSKVKRKHGTQKKIASEVKRPNSVINKPKSEVRITNCILDLRAPKSVVRCSSSKRVKCVDGFAPKRKSGK